MRENAPLPLMAGEVAWLGERRLRLAPYAISFAAGVVTGLFLFALAG